MSYPSSGPAEPADDKVGSLAALLREPPEAGVSPLARLRSTIVS